MGRNGTSAGGVLFRNADMVCHVSHVRRGYLFFERKQIAKRQVAGANRICSEMGNRMENDYVIVTDSTANLPLEMIRENEIGILPLHYYVEGEEYLGYIEGKDMDLQSFYIMMRDKKEVRTSYAKMEDARKLFEPILKAGKDVFYIAFSSGLSETYHTVSMLLESLKPKYPERKIYSVDSLAAALGEGLLVHYCIENRKHGMSIEENAVWLLNNRLHLCHWFTVDDLFFLRRGGRVSTATAVIGTTLRIKPVMHVDNEGRLVQITEVQGRRKALEALVEHMQECAVHPEEQVIYISHGDCREDAEYVAKMVQDRMHVRDIMVRILDPVIGAHSGPGTVALFFMGQER